MPLSLTHFRYLGRFLIYAICPTFQLTWQSDTEDRTRESGGSCDCSSVDNSVVVHETVECDKRRLVHFTKNAKSLDTSRKSRKTTSS